MITATHAEYHRKKKESLLLIGTFPEWSNNNHCDACPSKGEESQTVLAAFDNVATTSAGSAIPSVCACR